MSGKWYRVLSIDGGGIRGIIPAMILDTLEQQTGAPTYQLFDLIAGTSTGGILSLGMTRPAESGGAMFSAQQIVQLYEQYGQRIFTGKPAVPFTEEKYEVTGLESVLDQYFGETPLKQALTPVIITAYDIERRRPLIFKSTTAASTSPKSQQHDFLMKEVARATSAAPTYFEPAKIAVPGTQDYLPLIDGGVFANNPALCGYVEALKLNRDPDRKILVVSLGTGALTHPLMYGEVKNWGLIQWARQIIDIVFDGESDNVQYLLEHMVGDVDIDPGDAGKLVRLQAKLDAATAPMDKADAENIKALKLLAEDLIFNERERIEEVCKLLAPGGG